MGWRLVALSIGVALSSCAPIDPTAGISLTADTQVANDATPTTSSITSTFSPSATSTPSNTPEPTITLSPTIYATPPAFADTLLQEDVLFGQSIVPDCELPCWYGLRVGESKKSEIQEFFNNILGFNGTRDFFSGTELPVLGEDLPEGYSGTGYTWHAVPDPEQVGSGSISVRTYFEDQSYILGGIDLTFEFTPFARNITPQRVLRELGVPTGMYVSVSDPERSVDGWTSLTIVYSDGYVFEYQAVYTPLGDLVSGYKLCLDDYHWNIVYNAISMSVYLYEPFDEFPSLVTSQTPGLASVEDLLSASDFYNTSLEEITRLAEGNGQICLTHSNTE